MEEREGEKMEDEDEPILHIGVCLYMEKFFILIETWVIHVFLYK